MKQYLLPAAVVALLFPLYFLFGDVALSLSLGGRHRLIGGAAFYLFGLLVALTLCVMGGDALYEVLPPWGDKGTVLPFLAMATAVILGLLAAIRPGRRDGTVGVVGAGAA